MSQASKLQHHVFSNTALPYVSNSSPLSTDPQFIQGSYDVLTNLRGLAEKRPGFSAELESIASTFTALKRTYLWSKWPGTSTEQFYAIFCDVAGGLAKVYKYAFGSDTSAVLIYTSVSSAEPFDFVTANNYLYFGNGVDVNKKFLARTTADVTVYNWTIPAQPAAPGVSLGATGINASVGYQYRTTGYNSTTGGESSPSSASACTNTFTNQAVTVTWVDPTDTQADFVKVYRTTDGGSNDPTTMHLVATVARGVQTYTDTTADASLGTQTGPQVNYNDPLPPSKGFVWSQGRIWGFTNASSWYTGYEEITNGVPEECCPGGTLGILGGGNVYNWATQVSGHTDLPDGIAVFLPKTIWKIEGDSLDTFRRYILVKKRGAVNRACVTSLGSSVVWLDTSNQMWSSDLGEIGLPIRPDLAGIDQSQAYVAIHISNDQHWVCLLDGANGILYLFDLDTQQWLPPWNVGTTASALCSGEIAESTTILTLARNQTKALKLVANTFTDDGDTYAGAIRTGMLWIADASAFLERYDRSNPEWRGTIDNFEIKTGTDYADSVSLLMDDDPAQATYLPLSRIADANLDVPQGTYIKISRYGGEPGIDTLVGRMASLNAEWDAADDLFRIYQLDIAYQVRGQ
jgi:hypothetical protein